VDGAMSGMTKRNPLPAIAILIAMTSLELIVVGMQIHRASRITLLAGLLIAKLTLVIFSLMGGAEDRRSARLTLTALAFAAGVAVVLMLETVWRVNVT